MCHKDKPDLKGTAAVDYIRWGEEQAFHKRPSCRGRQPWWTVRQVKANAILVKEANDTSAVYYNPNRIPADCRLYCAQLTKSQLSYLNSPIGAMMFEIYNRVVLGEGARSLMVSDYNQVPCLAIKNKRLAHLFDRIVEESPRTFDREIKAE